MISQNIKTLRKARKLSQQRISDMLKIPRTTYCNWEQGQAIPKIESIKMLSKFFLVTIDEIVK